MREDVETTSRIKREELLGLLNTMTPMSEQRITAEMVAVVEPAPDDEPAPTSQAAPESLKTTAEIVVRFTSSTPSFHPPHVDDELVIADPETDRPSAQMLVIAASFMVTLIAGTFAILLA